MKKLREKGFEINGKTGITVRTVKVILNTDEVKVPARVYLTVRFRI